MSTNESLVTKLASVNATPILRRVLSEESKRDRRKEKSIPQLRENSASVVFLPMVFIDQRYEALDQEDAERHVDGPNVTDESNAFRAGGSSTLGFFLSVSSKKVSAISLETPFKVKAANTATSHRFRYILFKCSPVILQHLGSILIQRIFRIWLLNKQTTHRRSA